MNRKKTPASSLIGLPVRLFKHLSRARQYQFLGLLGLTVVGSFAEMISIGAVVPFIGILTEPQKVFAWPKMAPLISLFGIRSAAELLIPLALFFVVTAIVAALVRLALLWVTVKLNAATGIDLSVEVYRRTLYQPYSVHLSRNSSEIIAGVTQKVGAATGVLGALVNVATSGMVFLAIVTTLLLVDPQMAGIALLGFGSGYGLISWAVRRRLRENSAVMANEYTGVVKALQEGLGAFRDVVIDGTQRVYVNIFEGSLRPLQSALADNNFLTQSPRLAIESLAMVLLALMAVVGSRRPGGVGAALPILAALAVGAQRLLPLMQQLYNNWTVVAGGERSARDVLMLLDQPLPGHVDRPEPAPLRFTDSIRLENVRFRYTPASPWVFDGLNLEIGKGARIGLVGTTGSGKSTALDLIMLLLEPEQGRILVDGQQPTGELRRAWQRSIAHVPQNIFLADSSIAENIAFGVPRNEIDMEAVKRAAAQAHIAEFIESRREGYNARVGERGISISGGQRQRIGIARALYKRASVLVLDEATSALDDATERAVMDTIRGLTDDLTILIVAHRISTLQNCDTIIQLEHGRVVQRGSYADFVNRGSAARVLTSTKA